MGTGADPAAEGAANRVWTARMIAPACDAGVEGRASFVTAAFDLPEGAAAPVLHVSAQGLYVAYVNGRRVGEDLLTPGLTCYDDRIAYQSYDIGDLVRPGENRVDIWLADGWYRSQILWRDIKILNCWGDRIAAIAEIEAGGRVLLATGREWRSGLLPVTSSGIYYGEDHDARLEGEGASAGVEVVEFDTARLVPHETAPVVEMEPLAPVESWADGNATVHDFGQNVGGYVRFTVEGSAGDTVRVQHAEVLGPDRAFDNRNYRTARAESRYTLKGGGPETWAPHFTFMGYRYARISTTGGARVTKVESVPITSVPTPAGGFSCGVPEVDRLVLNTVWSQRANFIEIPTDCPQRDERLGWTGDAQVFSGTACWLADCERFLKKYLRDVRHDQRESGAVPHFSPDPTRLHPVMGRGEWAGSTGWGDAITVIPWQLYLHYGDEGVLRENFPAMVAWVEYLWSLGDGPIVATNAEWGGKGFTFGDWLQPIGDNRKPRPTIGDDCAATIYHFISTDLAARVAAILGEAGEADRLRDRAEEIRAAFAREFFTESGRMAHDDQTSYALAFLYGLVPDRHRAVAKARFRKVVDDTGGLIGTGFIGTPALLPALSRLGMGDVAGKVFLNRRVPGWLYQVERGATSIWERWDAMGEDGTIYDPMMNSYNHYAYGAVCQWLFEDVAGIAPVADAPGFDRVRVAPTILPALGHVEMWHDCRHGRIEAGWRVDGRRAVYTVNLPEGCEGVLDAAAFGSETTLDGKGVKVPAEGLALGSGRHELTLDLGG